MAQKRETRFRARIRPDLDALPNSFWESVQQRAIHGTADIIGCINGYFIWLELKTDEKAPVTMLQKHKIEMVKHAKGIAVVVTPKNWPDVYKGLKALSVCVHDGTEISYDEE